MTVHTKEKTLRVASECKSLQGHPSLRAPVRNHYRGIFVECGKPFSTSVRVTEQKTRRYSEHNYCGKALNVLSVSKKHEVLSRREGPVECHQSWKVIFPHSLGNWESLQTLVNIKTKGMPWIIPPTLGKVRSLDAKLVSVLILKNLSVILCCFVRTYIGGKP